MMGYRILIVDDEPEIAEGLQFLVERFCPGCQVAALAYDGNSGYEAAVKLSPDIVLTDIRMPECDGLPMIRRIQEAGVPAKYIVLSGYAEFEYAKTAITLGVKEFITKPVEEEDLHRVITQVCQEIQKEQEKARKVRHLKSTVQEYILKDFLNQNRCDSDVMKQHLEQLGFPVSGKKYICLEIERGDDRNQEQWEEFLRSAQKNGGKDLGFLNSFVVVPDTASSVIVAAALEPGMELRSLYYAVGKYRSGLARMLETTVCIGMGLPYREIESLPRSLAEARCALNYKILNGPDSVISYARIGEIKDRPTLVAVEDIKRLETSIDRLDDAGCREVVEDIFRKIGRETELSLKDLQQLSLNLILTGIRKIPYVQFQMNQYLGKNIFSLESISKFETVEQLKNWIINTLKGMNELMLRDHLPEKKDVIEEAKDYIAKHFNQEIGLNEIADRFFINPYYFSQLFKKKTGMTYQSYLITLRVERAKTLLLETDLRIYEICEMVGYSSSNHFNKVFERLEGMKPLEYRRLKR